jgi:hypothetical protein
MEIKVALKEHLTTALNTVSTRKGPSNYDH